MPGFIDATIARYLGPERIPKTLSEWALPVAATAAFVVGVNIVLTNTLWSDDGPPTVSSYIPWVGSAWAIDRDPDLFFKQAQETYPGGIFGVVCNGRKYYFVTSASVIKQIYGQPKLYTFSPVQAEWATTVFSLSEKTLGSTAFAERLAPHMSRSIGPKHMMNLVQAFDSQLSWAVKVYASPSGSVSLQEFVMKYLYLSTGAALFGPTFNASSSFDAFNRFDEMAWKVALGYPARFSRSFIKSRDDLINSFIHYLDFPHNPSDMIAGQERIMRNAGFDKRDMASLLLTAWWPLMANAPWATLWVLLLQLQRPEGVEGLIAELDSAGEAWSKANTNYRGPYTLYLTEFFKSSPPLPLMTSTISEMLRYATDSYSLRAVVTDYIRLGGYTLKKGDTLVCRTRSLHEDPSEFENADEYRPTRFLPEEGKLRGTEGDFNWMPFGGGVTMCSGRHFAQYYIKISLAVFLKNFSFQVDKEKSHLPIALGATNRGFGLRRPHGDLRVRVTRRV
ncbi:hypothetical protein FRB99_003056 [Tulasnella sp. 403]|nr:hypothetical protein FRB99_003056 [Tulasnella sp. 403]